MLCYYQEFITLLWTLVTTSGNRTPGSRSYSDLVHTLADSVCIHQLILKLCSKSASMQYNFRRLTYGSFQLTRVTWWLCCSIDGCSSEPWRPRRWQNITTALTTLPQGWVSAHKHQCTTYDVDRIFVGLSWELQCRWQLDRALERWQTTGRQKGS